MIRISSFSLVALVAVLHSGTACGQTSNSCAGHGFREDLQQGVVLTATSNAPAGAAGRAQLVAINDNGTNTAVLFVKTTGLTNGTYSVSLTQVGSTNTTSLGSLNVASSLNCCRFDFGFGHGRRFENDRKDERRHSEGRGRESRHGRGHGDDDEGKGDGDHHDGDNDDEDDDDGDGGGGIRRNFTNWVNQCSMTNSAFKHFVCGGGVTNRFCTNIYQWFTNCLTVGSGSFVLPSGLMQSNVAEVLISDSEGNVVLSGDFSGVTNSTSVYIETVNLVPGTATNLQGTATLTLTTRNARTVGAFKLSATGLEPREKLYLTANSTNTCVVRTSASGTLNVRTLPRTKLVNLQTLVATDVSSNIVFSASF